MLLTLTHRNAEAEIQLMRNYLAKSFEIKYLGNVRYFLSMKVERTKGRIIVTQRKYIPELLRETEMLGSSPCDTPILWTEPEI